MSTPAGCTPAGRRSRRSRWGPALLASGLLAGSVLLPALPAWAHASLASSDPAPGSRLEQLPRQVRLEFDEPMTTPAYVIVTAPDGSSAVAGAPQVDDTEVVQTLDPGAVEASTTTSGWWTLAFRVVSEDGHPVTGQVEFAVGDAAASPAEDVGDHASPAASSLDGSGGSPSGQDSTTVAAAPGSIDGLARSHGLAVGVALGLFAVAGVLLMASRRAPS